MGYGFEFQNDKLYVIEYQDKYGSIELSPVESQPYIEDIVTLLVDAGYEILRFHEYEKSKIHDVSDREGVE